MLKQILTITLALLTTVALAADLPKRKSGLWEISSTSSASGRAQANQPVVTMSMCVDQNSDADWIQSGQQMSQVKCSKQETKVERDRILFNSVCNFGKTTATSRGVVSGDFNKAYNVETHSTYEPPLAGMKEASSTITAKWLSPCKPGQRPGDIIMPNGTSINMNDMMKSMKK